jgi:hypothetical protein
VILARLGILPGLLLLAGSCVAPRILEMPQLAHAEVSNDFHTYDLRRVGLLPFGGEQVSREIGRAIQLGLFTEVSRAAPYEVVLLTREDLEELETSEPYRRGWYKPKTIIGISRRYNLDALMFGTVTQQRFFPPQFLSLQVDMVSAETGLVIWSSSIHVDASDQRVRDGLQLFYEGSGDNEEREDWELALLSPERFARFAAYQVALLL